MRAQRVITPIFVVLLLAALGILLVNECDHGGGMGAAYQSCDCLGLEWELYDRTAADGPRKTLCIGIVRSRACYAYIGGPRVACDRDPQVTLRTDKQAYALGQEITVTIENHLSSPISYNDLCSLGFCQYLDGSWVCQMKECYHPAVVLQAGRSTQTRFVAKGEVGPRQRFQFYYQISPAGTPYTAHSNEFRTEPKGPTPQLPAR